MVLVLALCLMLLATYYAQNYAGIIGWSLVASYLSLHRSSHSSIATLLWIFFKHVHATTYS